MMHKGLEWSEEEKAYLLHEQRLDAERVELTWREQLEQLGHALRECQRKEQRLLQEKEQERQEQERTQQEQAHLRALLLEAGIDPDH